MENKPKITLVSGTGKASGKPYTAISLEIGKWRKLHFPNAFEKDYLVENFKDVERSVTIDSYGKLQLIIGEYESSIDVPSSLETKYLTNYFLILDKQKKASTEDDSKIDLESEDELKENPFN